MAFLKNSPNRIEISDSGMERLNRLNQNRAIVWEADGINPMEVAPTLK